MSWHAHTMAKRLARKLLRDDGARLKRRLLDPILVGRRPSPAAIRLNPTQELFCRWNAERLGIDLEESRRRYRHSLAVVAGGHRGLRFNYFMYLSQEIYGVLFGNRPEELFDTYAFHGARDLLRQLANEPPVWSPRHPVVAGLRELPRVTIVDFGCGIAHASRALASALLEQGREVRLVLADIPTLQSEFLAWIGRSTQLDLQFLPCTRERPLPELPPCDLVIATEFFEHVPDPLRYLDAFDSRLRPGGMLLTNVQDHEPGFLHLSPGLGEVRRELARRGYEEVAPAVLFRKGIAAGPTRG